MNEYIIENTKFIFEPEKGDVIDMITCINIYLNYDNDYDYYIHKNGYEPNNDISEVYKEMSKSFDFDTRLLSPFFTPYYKVYGFFTETFLDRITKGAITDEVINSFKSYDRKKLKKDLLHFFAKKIYVIDENETFDSSLSVINFLNKFTSFEKDDPFRADIIYLYNDFDSKIEIIISYLYKIKECLEEFAYKRLDKIRDDYNKKINELVKFGGIDFIKDRYSNFKNIYNNKKPTDVRVVTAMFYPYDYLINYYNKTFYVVIGFDYEIGFDFNKIDKPEAERISLLFSDTMNIKIVQYLQNNGESTIESLIFIFKIKPQELWNYVYKLAASELLIKREDDGQIYYSVNTAKVQNIKKYINEIF